MAHEGVKHDYHLVNPSPWPLLGSFAAFVLTFSGVVWMKGLFGVPREKVDSMWILLPGVLLVIITMITWWSDVVKEANGGDHTPVVQLSHRYGMILFIASEVMFFVAWFWIFFEMALFHGQRSISPVQQVADAWKSWPPKGVEVVPPFELPLVNTLTLLLSGTTVTWAHHALQTGDRNGAKFGLVLTILLGMLFTSIQAFEYHHILTDKLFFGPEALGSGLYGSSFFMATGFHGFHVIIGTIFLTVCLIRLLGGGFTPKKHFGFEAAAWYWHFVDVVWLFLFTFLYFTFGAGWGK